MFQIPNSLLGIGCLLIRHPHMTRLIRERAERAAAWFVKLAIEFNILESCAMHKRTERIDRDIEPVQCNEQHACDQNTENAQHQNR